MTDGSIRFLAGLSLAALAAITGIVSYLHALTVVYLTGSAGLVAYLIPFVADLMIVTVSLAILSMQSATTRPNHRWPWFRSWPVSAQRWP